MNEPTPAAESRANHPPDTPGDQPAEGAASQSDVAPIGFVAEFIQFLREEKKWWLTPIVVSLILIVLAALLMKSPAAPFIYPQF